MNRKYSYHLIIFIQKLIYSSYTPVEEIVTPTGGEGTRKIYQWDIKKVLLVVFLFYIYEIRFQT